MNEELRAKREQNPKEKAGFLSRISFAYVLPLYIKGFKSDLKENDMYNVMTKLKAQHVGNKLEKCWNYEKSKSKNPSILKALIACFGKTYLILVTVQFVVFTCFLVLSPWIMKMFILYFTTKEMTMSKLEAFSYGYALVLINFLEYALNNHYKFYEQEFSITVTKALSSLIYRKTLKLDTVELNKSSTGNILTVLAKDIESIKLAIDDFGTGFIMVIQLGVLFYLIYSSIGSAAIYGFGLMFLWFPVQAFLAFRMYQARMRVNRETDKRLQITKECLSAIRILKMYVWENYFVKMLLSVRKKEIGFFRQYLILETVVFCFAFITARVSTIVIFKTYTYFGNVWTAELIYYIISCFQKFIMTVGGRIPIMSNRLSIFMVSMNRINNVLNAKEIDIQQIQSNTKPPVIQLSSVNVVIGSQNILNNITFKIMPGLNILTGDVGSGKSSLLKTILKEYSIADGRIQVQGRISYASQDPWLFPSSIKQNILFGQPFNKSRYERILEVCDLSYDIGMFSSKDETIIIDKGINVSKGQQCRINLARALYKESDIYLLDDCLAAIDNRVKKLILQRCVSLFKNKLCIFVTNDINLFYEVDNVIVLKHGKVYSTGNNKIEIANNIFNNAEISQNHNKADVKLDKEEKITEESALLDNNSTEESTIYQEDKKDGRVDIKTYKRYLQLGGGYWFSLLVVVSCFFANFCSKYGERLMSLWINNEELKTDTQKSTTSLVPSESFFSYFNMFVMFAVGSELVHSLKDWLFYIFGLTSSKTTHSLMINGIIGSKISFFDLHMTGNILNRFSNDLRILDEELYSTARECVFFTAEIIGLLLLISTIEPLFIVFSVILGTLFVLVSKCALPTARSLKRLDAAAYSPIIGHLSTTFDGLVTIRASGNQQILITEFDNAQDFHTSVRHIAIAAYRGLIMLYQILGNFYLATIITRYFISDKDNLAGDVGLTISQVMSISSVLEYCISSFISIETQMTHLERLLEYANVKQEENNDHKNNDIKHNGWPKTAVIKFDQLSLHYRKTEPILKNLTFTIKSNEKIGVVGRTGAGKSSIISSLFGLYETGGKIIIDDIDTKTIPLKHLRKNISIIPQDPHIFRGTIRDNLDPFNDHTDEKIWDALTAVNLKPLINNLSDDIKKYEFSLGRKQLICLARCILKKNKIIVVDEITANMDESMDILVQAKIEEVFKDCTMIIVAHRLHNVMNCNKVMVLNNGRIVEFDDPKMLLKNSKSAFYGMVNEKKK